MKVRTFSRTVLNLTWLCAKACPNLFPNLLLNPLALTWFCTKSSHTFSGFFFQIFFSGTFSGTRLWTQRLAQKSSHTHTCLDKHQTHNSSRHTTHAFHARSTLSLTCILGARHGSRKASKFALWGSRNFQTKTASETDLVPRLFCENH